VSVLVNAAGLGQAESLHDGDVEAWREMFDVNVIGLSVVTREAVRSMLRREVAGHVIHLGSLSGHRVPNATGPYSATKFAVRALAETLRQELRRLGSPIRITCVSPGFVETEFHRYYLGDAHRAAELYARHRVLDAADVAEAVLYALSAPRHVDVSDILLRSTEQSS
jgi:NADP-dependent 3-hydroxy acid dehydrogenase YdfG